MMELLLNCRVDDSTKYVALSEKLALKGERERDWDRARTYWEIKAQWHRLAREEVELRTLLVERFGANLRNDMSHGLVGHDNFYSASVRYLWWLALHLYSFPVLARLKVAHEQRADESAISVNNGKS